MSGSTVTQWSDQSGNQRHATQSLASSQPVYRPGALNGSPTVQFDGVNDFSTTLPVNGLTGVSIFGCGQQSNQSLGPTHSENAALFWNETQGWGTVHVVRFNRASPPDSARPKPTIGSLLASHLGGNCVTITTAIKNGSTDTLFVNGTQVLSEGGKLTAIAGCRDTASVGRGFNDDTFYAGDIAEIVVCPRLVSFRTATVEQYL